MYIKNKKIQSFLKDKVIKTSEPVITVIDFLKMIKKLTNKK